MPFDPASAVELLKNAPKGAEINVNESGVPSVRFDPSGVQVPPMESIQSEGQVFPDALKSAIQAGAADQLAAQIAEQPQKRRDQITGMALQYGLPLAVGLAAPPSTFAFLGPELAPVASILTNMAVTGLGTFGAAGLDNSKSLDDMVREGVSAATWDAAFGIVAPVAGRALARGLLTDKTFKPLSGLDKMAVDAGEVLSGKGMALTPDMRPDASPLAKFVGGYLRGSTRESALFQKDNATKLAAIGEVYDGMMESVGAKTDAITLGNSIRAMLLGPTEESSGRIISGGMDAWIDQTKTAFYQKAEGYYAGKVKVPYENARELLVEMSKFKDTEEIGPAYKALEKYMPENFLNERPVKHAANMKSPLTPETRNAQIAELESKLRGIRENTSVMPGAVNKPTLLEDRLQTQLDALKFDAEWAQRGVTESRAELPQIPIEDLIQAKRDVVSGIKASKGKQGRFKGLSGATDKINNVIYDEIQRQAGDDALAAFATAETFSAVSKSVHEQALAKSIVTKLKNNPSSLSAFMLQPSKLPDAIDQLERVWKLGTSGFEGLSPKGTAKLPSFEDGVKAPLRYLMLADAFTEATGTYNSMQAVKTFEKYPVASKLKLFGAQDVDTWNKVVNAGAYLTDVKMIDRMVPRMMESGLLATAMFSGISGNAEVAGSAAKSLLAIGMSAAGLGRLFRNPKFAQNTLDGVLAGPASSRYVSAVQNLMAAGIAEMSEARDGGEFYLGTPGKIAEIKKQREQEQAALAQTMAQQQAQGAQGMLSGGQGGMAVGP